MDIDYLVNKNNLVVTILVAIIRKNVCTGVHICQPSRVSNVLDFVSYRRIEVANYVSVGVVGFVSTHPQRGIEEPLVGITELPSV